MSGVLLDTCTFAWLVMGKKQISLAGQSAIDAAGDDLFVSAATSYEIAQKVRLGKWEDMAPYARALISRSCLRSSQILQIGGPICIEAGATAWEHRDPFDRLIAVTARTYRLPIASADRHLDGIVPRIW